MDVTEQTSPLIFSLYLLVLHFVFCYTLLQLFPYLLLFSIALYNIVYLIQKIMIKSEMYDIF